MNTNRAQSNRRKREKKRRKTGDHIAAQGFTLNFTHEHIGTQFVSCLSSTPGCCCGRWNDENAHK